MPRSARLRRRGAGARRSGISEPSRLRRPRRGLDVARSRARRRRRMLRWACGPGPTTGSASGTTLSGDFESARESAAEARRLAVEAGASEAELRALGNLGATSIELEDFDAAAGYLELTIELARKRSATRPSLRVRATTSARCRSTAIRPPRSSRSRPRSRSCSGRPAGRRDPLPGRLGDAHWLLGQPSEACRLLTASLRLAGGVASLLLRAGDPGSARGCGSRVRRARRRDGRSPPPRRP